MRAPISAIVLARNEEKNIGRCLDALAWVDEVILVDNHSTDTTVAIASSYSNVRAFSCDWLGFSGNKKYGLQQAKHKWILWVDADEVITAELRNEILSVLNYSGSLCDAYDFPRKAFFMGIWIQHCGWYPGRVLRLFQRDRASFNDKILHEGVDLVPGARIGHLKYDMLHFSYTSVAQYFDKMNRSYGMAGAQELVRKGKRFHLWDLIFRPIIAFIKFYFFKLGILDGIPGLIVCVGSGFSTFIKYTNLYFLTRTDIPPES